MAQIITHSKELDELSRMNLKSKNSDDFKQSYGLVKYYTSPFRTNGQLVLVTYVSLFLHILAFFYNTLQINKEKNDKESQNVKE